MCLTTITIVALWKLPHLGRGMCAYTLWGRIALWSHQSAQTASSERYGDGVGDLMMTPYLAGNTYAT